MGMSLRGGVAAAGAWLDRRLPAERYLAVLGDMLEQKNILLESEYMIMEVDHGQQVIRSYDERDGMHGLRLVYESRGYTLDDDFTQTVEGYGGLSWQDAVFPR